MGGMDMTLLIEPNGTGANSNVPHAVRIGTVRN